MLERPIISYGFGRHRGRVCSYEAHGAQLGRLAPCDALKLVDIPDSATFAQILDVLQPPLVIMPPVSPYSHFASAIWCSGVPVVSMQAPDALNEGDLVVVDFEHERIYAVGTHDRKDDAFATDIESELVGDQLLHALSHGPRLYSEITSLSEGERALRDGAYATSIIKIEQIASDPSGGFAGGLLTLSRRFPIPDRLKIRFYDDEGGIPIALPSWMQPSRSLGFRGVRAFHDQALQDSFLAPLLALRDTPIIVMLPMVSTVDELRVARQQVSKMSPNWSIGATIETPSAALLIDELLPELAFVEIGLNDLSQYTLGWDRNAVNEALLPHDRVAPAVAKLIASVAKHCRNAEVECALGLDLRPQADLARQLVSLGIEAISCAPPLVPQWRAAWPA